MRKFAAILGLASMCLLTACTTQPVQQEDTQLRAGEGITASIFPVKDPAEKELLDTPVDTDEEDKKDFLSPEKISNYTKEELDFLVDKDIYVKGTVISSTTTEIFSPLSSAMSTRDYNFTDGLILRTQDIKKEWLKGYGLILQGATAHVKVSDWNKDANGNVVLGCEILDFKVATTLPVLK